ncbi:MFS transporter [Pseudonocardia acaciae]|uniref:MFS transporter n=1 Tax=Pseudonocardia acaciae TaxID=551276 RepID=UPI00048E8708|nr:MFS transporter [Pseudonocardia acaciae]
MTSTEAAPTVQAPPEGAARRRSRATRVLQATSVLSGFAQSLSSSASALLAAQVGGSDQVAGWPQTAVVAGAAGASVLLSRLAGRRGRRAALSTGALVAIAGCTAVALGAVLGRLSVILLGSLLLGAGNATVMLSRYAAADLAPQRARAMASVLTATTIGAAAGPNLLAWSSGAAAGVGLPALSGPYLFAAVGFAAAVGTLLLGLPDALLPARAAASASRPVPAGFGGRSAVGLVVLAIANLVMVGVMTMAPVHMRHAGSGLSIVGLVIGLHIAGMFAPSPVSGWLTGRVGPTVASAGAGAVLTASSVLAAVGAHSAWLLAVAMTLLGVGWNLALIAGSTLLTEGLAPARRPRREGWGEVGMGGAAAAAGILAGPLMGAGGYPLLALVGAGAAACVIPIALFRR